MPELSSLEYFLHLTITVAEFCGILMPVTLTVILAALVTTAAAFAKPDVRWRRVLAAWVLPAPFPILALLVGVAYVDSSSLAFMAKAPPRPWFVGASPRQPELWLLLIGTSFLVTMALLAWSLRRSWGVVLASALFWGQLLFLAITVAQMSYTGTWL